MKNLLIINDKGFSGCSLGNVIDKNSCCIIGGSADCKAAVEMYRKLKPDIVAMDVTVPELGCMNVIEMIRKIDVNARIVVVSGVWDKSAVSSMLKAGVVSLILKPFVGKTFF